MNRRTRTRVKETGTNALTELREIISLTQIKCAKINDLTLNVGYDHKEYAEFVVRLSKIDYDSSFGTQELYGTIWLKDGETWLTRGEYDGSEWWEVNNLPEIPDELK